MASMDIAVQLQRCCLYGICFLHDANWQLVRIGLQILSAILLSSA